MLATVVFLVAPLAIYGTTVALSTGLLHRTRFPASLCAVVAVGAGVLGAYLTQGVSFSFAVWWEDFFAGPFLRGTILQTTSVGGALGTLSVLAVPFGAALVFVLLLRRLRDGSRRKTATFAQPTHPQSLVEDATDRELELSSTNDGL